MAEIGKAALQPAQGDRDRAAHNLLLEAERLVTDAHQDARTGLAVAAVRLIMRLDRDALKCQEWQ